MTNWLSKIFKRLSGAKTKATETLMPYSKLEKTIIDIEAEYQEMSINSKSKDEIEKLNKDKELDIIAVKQLWNEKVVTSVSRHLKIMGYDLVEDGADIAIKLMISGYNEIETASYISLISMALDVKADLDVERMFMINAHAVELLKILKQYKDAGLMRQSIWENDSKAMFNIATPSERVEEWVDKILSDEMIKGKELAKSRINYKSTEK